MIRGVCIGDEIPLAALSALGGGDVRGRDPLDVGDRHAAGRHHGHLSSQQLDEQRIDADVNRARAVDGARVHVDQVEAAGSHGLCFSLGGLLGALVGGGLGVRVDVRLDERSTGWRGEHVHGRGVDEPLHACGEGLCRDVRGPLRVDAIRTPSRPAATARAYRRCETPTRCPRAVRRARRRLRCRLARPLRSRGRAPSRARDREPARGPSGPRAPGVW